MKRDPKCLGCENIAAVDGCLAAMNLLDQSFNDDGHVNVQEFLSFIAWVVGKSDVHDFIEEFKLSDRAFQFNCSLCFGVDNYDLNF